MQTSAPIADVASAYKKGMTAKGWESEVGMSIGPQTMLVFKKAGRQDAALQIMRGKGTTTIVLTAPQAE